MSQSFSWVTPLSWEILPDGRGFKNTTLLTEESFLVGSFGKFLSKKLKIFRGGSGRSVLDKVIDNGRHPTEMGYLRFDSFIS